MPTAAPSTSPTPEPPPAPRYYWEDFPVGRVREFGGMLVTREAIVEFARAYDPQPFHLDDAAAATSLFGRLAASGWHTCAMAMRMMCDAYLLESAALGSPGVENVRWLKPVHPGDTLHVRLTVLEARPSVSRPGVGLVKSHWDVSNQHDEAVLSMEGWGLFRCRPSAQSPVQNRAPREGLP